MKLHLKASMLWQFLYCKYLISWRFTDHFSYTCNYIALFYCLLSLSVLLYKAHMQALPVQMTAQNSHPQQIQQIQKYKMHIAFQVGCESAEEKTILLFMSSLNRG